MSNLVYITEHARATPDKPAIVMAETGVVTTFGQLEAASNRAAHLFRKLGLGPRSHMALVIENRSEFFEVCFGADRAGLYYTPISTRLSAPEVAYVVSDAGARVLVITADFAEMAVELRAQCKLVERFYMIGGTAEGYESWEDAVAAMPATPVADEMQGRDMLYSSGTTGKPKGIKRPINGDPVGTRSYFVDNGYSLYGYGPDMVYLSPAPLYHAAPLRYCMLVSRVGGTLVIMQHFDAEGSLRLIDQYKVTHSNWVPTMFVRMLKLPSEIRSRYDLSSHRVAIHGAGPVSAATKQQMIDWWGPVLFEYYAASEGNGMTFITSQDWLTHKGSVGRAIIGELHIVDDESGRELGVGESGLVYFANGQPFAYHNDDGKTKQAFNDKGWSTLGDVGYVDAEGYLYLTDRKAFMIISGGVNIYPQEAENVLIEHPKVADVAVIGVPNEDFGEEVKAVVQPVDMKEAGPALAEELLAYCRQHLAGIKCPRSVDFEEALPRHATGKLYKRLIKDRYWGNRTSRIV
ncbi:MAG: acyl-CoA synthetase [Ferrovibrio sp.]|uniref:acyl-CoA synthetase n=1 Tax=Ferrovibrio sp. TaxID=1917215 RepID=UPI0026378135|nr:acyl-CoA synthetase [Ferrovibrio sp.]MCW0234454.1 acyl-CoA synthetase [Ferrovibrio sp.]